ncbi:MAG: FkbM family methyltransferase [Planctomycetaceae bacterium]|nr:FkbM family methyltransferase [Planctomycetaceae bacterium]
MSKLQKILNEREFHPPLSAKDAFEKLNNQQILLYGAGAFGLENYNLFTKYGIKPIAFLDRNAKTGDTKMGIPVYHPNDSDLTMDFRNKCLVFITISLPQDKMKLIKNDLYELGYVNCREAQTMTARQVRFDDVADENPDNNYIKKNQEKIFRAINLMADEESCETYISCIAGHLLRNYDDCVETNFPVQYFDAGIPYKRGLSHFVDCGAYTGDSLQTALQYCDFIEDYVAFEPIPSNFTELSQNVDLLKQKIKRAWLFPCGVDEKTGMAKFSVSASSSAITDNADGELLQLVRLDDALKGFNVTLLKMDIEGAEPAALRGSQNLITQQKPDLAISVYHSVNHYWDIPCMLDDLKLEYRFYLRSHTPATLETILYAVCNK